MGLGWCVHSVDFPCLFCWLMWLHAWSNVRIVLCVVFAGVFWGMLTWLATHGHADATCKGCGAARHARAVGVQEFSLRGMQLRAAWAMRAASCLAAAAEFGAGPSCRQWLVPDDCTPHRPSRLLFWPHHVVTLLLRSTAYCKVATRALNSTLCCCASTGASTKLPPPQPSLHNLGQHLRQMP